MNAVVKINGVTKRFGRTDAVADVSLEIPAGVVFALLGENGAGKTTLIRMLTGFLKPDTGLIRVLGQDASHASESLRGTIGYVSDSPPLYDWMRADEIGWFTSAFYDEGFLEAYTRLIDGFDVPATNKLKHLSKGQRAKVALSLAIAHDPQLLILDEPTAGLDPMVRRSFLESMVDRAAIGRTVLLSSHHIAEVERVADVVAIMHDGEIRLVAPLQELRTSTHVVTMTLQHGDVVVGVPRGEILSEDRNGRQMRWVIRDSPDDGFDDFTPEDGVDRIDVQPAGLEDIFVAICQSKPADGLGVYANDKPPAEDPPGATNDDAPSLAPEEVR